MSDWTAGYVADIGYTFGYYNELNPQHTRLAFLNAGLVVPVFKTACELGFGQGLSINIHAASSNCTWYGTDFNPAQAGFAQELAGASGVPVSLYDQAFAEFAQRDELPEFDFIGIHGIWSWISDENRTVIVDFIRRKLKVGGVVYVSYNTLPGWASFAPMRHLMTQHAEIIGAAGTGIVSRINDALEFSEKLLNTNPLYARANPQVNERLGKLKDQNRHYLAHEYFNRDWHPMHFATMSEWLEPAKLQFACSAHYLDQVESINLTGEQQEILASIPDRMFRQSVRDFMVNQQFRRDYWVKGLRRISDLEKIEQLRAQKVLLVTPREDVEMKVKGSLVEASMENDIYVPILNLLADHKVRSIGEIENSLKANNLRLNQIVEATLVLVGCSHLNLIQEGEINEQTRLACRNLNGHIMMKARSSNEVSFLASPVTGKGITVQRFHQLFQLGQREGLSSVDQLAAYAWKILDMQGQKIIKDGKALEATEDNLAELKESAGRFLNKVYPIMRALAIE